ncbi:MAG: hypothetical protein IKU09_04085 [Firmicutes bacterium]|nr:hypothetical protein [Bacillota bacterium]
MEALFLHVLNMSFVASWVILILLVVRLMIKKAPRWIVCLMWTVPVFRLLCPVTFESVYSLMPVKSQSIPQNIAMDRTPAIDSGSAFVDNAVNHVLAAPAFTPDMGDSANPLQVYQFIGTWVWVIGMAALAVYSLISLWQLHRRLLAAVPADKNIYWCPNLESAFVVGLFCPKIYLPVGLNPTEAAYILRHEEIHIRRMDHWLKAFAFLTVCIHWFNPFVWLMFVLISRDMEMACDEAVLSELGEEKELKKAYSASLLNLAAGRRIMTGIPLAFGEGDVKSRVKNVLSFRRPKTWVVAVTLAVCVLLGAGLLTDRVDSRVQIGHLDSLDDLGDSAIKGSIELWYEQCRHEAGVIHTYPLENDYVGPKEDGYLVYYHHGTDHYSYFEIQAKAKGDDLEFEIIEHDAVSEEHMSSEAFAIVRFKEGEFPLDDVEQLYEILGGDEAEVQSYIDNESSPLPPNEARNMAYIRALEGVLKNGVFPDGTAMPPELTAEMDQNVFAVCDVDGDGSHELILNFMGGPMAAKSTRIYDYNELKDCLRPQLEVFPNLTYYDNGYIRAGWSHNQGLAGNRDDFWPYTLYRYESRIDEYRAYFSVDAWDRSLAETGPDGEPWPADVDQEDAGIVYWIMAEELKTVSYGKSDLASVSGYEEFLRETIGSAQQIEIPFVSLNEENIASLVKPGAAAQ